jgi:hypothetical protein
MDNCPNDFYLNCKNSGRKCKICAAGFRKNGRLFYDPVDDLGLHPIQKQPELDKGTDQAQAEKTENQKQQSRYIKGGFRNERKTLRRIRRKVSPSVIRPTLRSGAVHGDGDYYLLQGILRGDAKRRFKAKSFTLKWEEYAKRGVINHWYITIERDGIEHTVVVLTERAFVDLLNLLPNGPQEDYL